MCGRYVLAIYQELSERFQARQLRFALASVYNVAPSQKLPVFVEEANGGRTIRLMQWGLIPRWQRLGHASSVAPINARVETVAEKPMFRELIRRQRCLVPASGFYEWAPEGRSKRPWFIGLMDEPLFAFAGLYDERPGTDGGVVGSYAILTTRANPLVPSLHDRMPVILRPDDEATWLDRALTDPRALEPLWRPRRSAELVAYPVSRAVNDARHDGPELVSPQETAEAA